MVEVAEGGVGALQLEGECRVAVEATAEEGGVDFEEVVYGLGVVD